jgi:hypothetical protein
MLEYRVNANKQEPTRPTHFSFLLQSYLPVLPRATVLVQRQTCFIGVLVAVIYSQKYTDVPLNASPKAQLNRHQRKDVDVATSCNSKSDKYEE